MTEQTRPAPLNKPPTPPEAPPKKVEPQPKKGDFIRIRNNTLQIRGIGTQHAEGADGVQIGVALTLAPGVNKVARKHWDVAKKQKMVQLAIEENHLEEIDGQPIQAMPEAAAIRLVKETHKIEMLNEFKAADKRVRVQKAIDDELKKLHAVIEQEDIEEDADAAE